MSETQQTTDTQLLARLVAAAEKQERSTYAIQVILTIWLILSVIGAIVLWATSL